MTNTVQTILSSCVLATSLLAMSGSAATMSPEKMPSAECKDLMSKFDMMASEKDKEGKMMPVYSNKNFMPMVDEMKKAKCISKM